MALNICTQFSSTGACLWLFILTEASCLAGQRATSRAPRAPTKPPGTQNRGRPARAIDARSFAAPKAGNDSPKIIRSPRLRNIRSGNQAAGRNSKPIGRKAGPKAPKQPRARRARQFEVDEGEDVRASEIEQLEQEQTAKARPAPVRYDPQEISFSTLRETWPSLPTDANAQSAAILEKLTSLSGRFPNGYVPPYELGRRLWNGHSVLFESEAEKADAMEEVKRLTQLRADKMSQRKGDLVEPRDVEFSAVNTEDAKTLVATFAQGKYPALEAAKDQPAVLGEVVKNLRNNGTYQTAGKRPQFLAKVESLLASSRVKRT